jgi:hypothetical protein
VRNRMFHNKGDGTFESVEGRLKVALPQRSFPVWFWDFDNDGKLDLYVSAYWSNIKFFAAQALGIEKDVEPARLYRGDGKGGFEDVAIEMGLGRIANPMGANFGDLDNDGYPDFYLGTGYPDYDALMPNVMYWNRGGKRFDDVTTAGGFGHLQKGHAVVFADYDNDGDQDVFEQMGGAFPGDGFRDILFENPGFGHHWLQVKLTGVQTNRSAIGARVRALLEEGGKQRSVYTWVNSGGSFGANPLRREIGLGAADRLVALEVYWPTSDLTQTFPDVAMDQAIAITEGESSYQVVRPPVAD